MKKIVIFAATVVMFVSPVAAQEKLAPHCDHIEMMLWKLEDTHKLKEVRSEPGFWVYQDRSGNIWVVKSDGEEACVTKGKEK